VKTRLARSLGAEAAAMLSQAFFLDTWRSAADCVWAHAILATTDPGAAHWAGIASIWDQGGGDLGERVERVLSRALQSAPVALAIGADTPGLPPRFLELAQDALTTSDAVLGPCEDGGFYLIGLRSCPPGLFAGLPWSTERIFEQTLQRLRDLGFTVKTLPPWFDLDRVEDLARIQGLLARKELDAPETERALRLLSVADGLPR
jgi:rSAM/selenodomain-associated transferase 1